MPKITAQRMWVSSQWTTPIEIPSRDQLYQKGHCTNCDEGECVTRLLNLVDTQRAKEESALIRSIRFCSDDAADRTLKGWQNVHPYPKVLIGKKRFNLNNPPSENSMGSLILTPSAIRSYYSCGKSRPLGLIPKSGPDYFEYNSFLSHQRSSPEKMKNIKVTGSGFSTVGFVDISSLSSENTAKSNSFSLPTTPELCKKHTSSTGTVKSPSLVVYQKIRQSRTRNRTNKKYSEKNSGNVSLKEEKPCLLVTGKERSKALLCCGKSPIRDEKTEEQAEATNSGQTTSNWHDCWNPVIIN